MRAYSVLPDLLAGFEKS